MKVRATRSFIDKYSMKSIPKATEFEVTEERFSELTAGPRGIFVEEIKEDTPVDSPKQPDNENTPPEETSQGKEEKQGEDTSTTNVEKDINLDKLNKSELVEYAEGKGIELNMEMTKNIMIEILQKK